jgi:hypothetical protein
MLQCFSKIIIIIIIIIGKDTVFFMQGIYTYTPETNHVPKECNVAAILSLLFIIIIIIIDKDTVSFMQGIYTYIPETNHAPKQYNVAAILSQLFMVPISLAAALAITYFCIRTFRSMCAVPNIAVFL